MTEDLRRNGRIGVCCRAIVRDRYGVWTGVTHDLGRRGCQLVTARQLRAGARVLLSLSSDLFPEELEVTAEVVWVTPVRLGLVFLASPLRAGSLSPGAWFDRVLLHGTQVDSGGARRMVPSVRRGEARPVAPSAGGLARTTSGAAAPLPRGGSPAQMGAGRSVWSGILADGAPSSMS
jgi:hypothetical protein